MDLDINHAVVQSAQLNEEILEFLFEGEVNVVAVGSPFRPGSQFDLLYDSWRMIITGLAIVN